MKLLELAMIDGRHVVINPEYVVGFAERSDVEGSRIWLDHPTRPSLEVLDEVAEVLEQFVYLDGTPNDAPYEEASLTFDDGFDHDASRQKDVTGARPFMLRPVRWCGRDWFEDDEEE